MSGRTIITTEQRRPLSEWVRSFHTLFGQQQLLGGHTNSTTTLLPDDDDYLIPALRIASSLADQICKAEEAGQSPTPSSDWMDSIVVHLQSNNSEDGRFEGKAAEEEEDSFGVKNVSNNEVITKGTSPTSEEEGKDGEGGNNIRVEILPSLLFHTTDNDNSREATDGILYSLGMVFYELFSRGERPVELEQQQVEEKPNGSQETEESSEELPEGFNPFDQGGTIDLEGECSIFDSLLGEYNLADDDSLYDDIASQGQGPRKKQTQNGHHNLCSVSVEPLKAKGIPRALCDLVANMVDCANGTISKNETYRNLSEVRDDLQLMLDNPSIYLHNQDMGTLSTTGLQFGGTVFGRNAELSTIIDAYRRSVSGESESESVTLSGPAGAGKSLLAGEFIERKHCYMMSTKQSKTSKASASKMGEEEEQDLAVLLSKFSKTAKARAAAAVAAAAAAKEKEQVNAASCMRSRTTSTRKRSITANPENEASMDRPGKRSAANKIEEKNSEDNQKAGRKADWRKYAKICSADGCTLFAQKGGVCIKHGATVKQCSSGGCTNQARKGGVCLRHGAKVKLCSSEGCTNQACKGGVCKRHGAKVKVKSCISEGCNNFAVKGGVCKRHGAKVELCKSAGCTNQVQRGGVCKRHGAKPKSLRHLSAFGSEYEKTTATLNLTNQSAAGASHERSNCVPGEVAICQEIVEV